MTKSMKRPGRVMSTTDISTFTSTFNQCLQSIQELEKSYVVKIDFIAQFKRFTACFYDCLAEIKRNAVLPHNQLYKSKIQLCLSQVSKALTRFGSVINQPLYRIVWYLCEQLRWCVSEICRVLNGSVTDEDCYYDSSGSFLYRIDLALQLLDTCDATVPSTWKQLVDDLIYQAVTIAKIASHIDYKEITSACHKLLAESTQLEGERDLPQLQRDSLSVGLATLERRVNTAVLRLLLQVFSEPNKPLKQLVRCCRPASQPRSTSDLDDLIVELDTHIERVIVIGQFAVSCCEDADRVAGIRCCLASLESVDNYLVPALSALYTSPNCQDKQAFVRYLCDHWQNELSRLHTLLDAIIDSYAFSRIVQESMNDLRDRLCEGELGKEIGQTLVRQGWLLYKHLSKIHDPSQDNSYLARLKQAVHECEAAVSKQASLSAVFKRVGLLTAAVDSVCEQLAASINTPPHTDHASGLPDVMGSMKDLPLDISFMSISNSQHASYRPQWLQKKILGEKENKQKYDLNITKVLTVKNTAVENPVFSPRTLANVTNTCGTPENTAKCDANLLTPYLRKTAERNTTLYMRTPRKVMQSRVMDTTFTDNVPSSDSACDKDHSLVLDITSVLESLSVIADTLSSTKGDESVWSQVKPTPPADVMKRYFSGSSFDSKWFSLASVRTDEVSDVNTPERLQDLKELDEKIKNLKLS